MPSVPFPVITLFALLLLFTAVWFSGKREQHGTLRFIVACIFLMTVCVLRWEYESDLLRQCQAMFAALLPPIAWHSFISLTEEKKQHRLLLLLGPAAGTIIIELLWPAATDFMLFLLFCSYGIGLIRTAWQGENAFTLTRFSESFKAPLMAFFAGCFLCISALTDLAVSVDFIITEGKQAPIIISLFQGMLLPLIGLAIIFASKTVAKADGIADVEIVSPSHLGEPSYEQTVLYAMLEEQIREKQLYLNPDLTLTVLARKTGVPVRQLSGTVNAIRQCNVSQWINGFRIERAQELLRNTVLPVTEIMLETGFMTKSNFNREFQRICGMTPTAFRQQTRDNPGMSSGTL